MLCRLSVRQYRRSGQKIFASKCFSVNEPKYSGIASAVRITAFLNFCVRNPPIVLFYRKFTQPTRWSVKFGANAATQDKLRCANFS